MIHGPNTSKYDIAKRTQNKLFTRTSRQQECMLSVCIIQRFIKLLLQNKDDTIWNTKCSLRHVFLWVHNMNVSGIASPFSSPLLGRKPSLFIWPSWNHSNQQPRPRPSIFIIFLYSALFHMRKLGPRRFRGGADEGRYLPNASPKLTKLAKASRVKA
jgi:hypothetical protein